MPDILITLSYAGPGCTLLVRHTASAHYIHVLDRRTAYIQVPAVAGQPDRAGVEAALATLRGIWGPLPVTDETGLFGNLT